MRDRELYATILGVAAPWTVERVEVDLEGNAVHVWLQREMSGVKGFYCSVVSSSNKIRAAAYGLNTNGDTVALPATAK